MTTNGARAPGLLAEISEFGPRIQGAIDELMAQRAEIDAELRQLRRLAAAFGVEIPTTAIKKNKITTMRAPTVGEVARAILAKSLDSPTFSALDLQDSVSVSQPTLYSGVKLLRDNQLIGKAGQVRIRKGSTPRQTYRILDREQLEQIASGGA